MTKETLKFISDVLTAAGINYEFGQWSGEIVYPYWVGEYIEQAYSPEDGYQETTFTLNGFSRTTWLDLENAKEIIERLFSNSVQILQSGNGVCIFYEGTTIIPENDAELKRMQIDLTIKEWKVN